MSTTSFSSCYSWFLVLRPVLFSTELSSFSRLGGITSSPPVTGFLPATLLPMWEEVGNGMGCRCLDEDGEGSWGGWQTSAEGRRSGRSGGLTRSLWFGQLDVWCRLASFGSLGLASLRETLLFVSCGRQQETSLILFSYQFGQKMHGLWC